MAQVAIVTGGAPGAAAASAVRLAGRGFDIALFEPRGAADPQVAVRVATLGRVCLPVAADVADEASVAAAVERVRGELGDPAVLVNTVRSEGGWGADPRWLETAAGGLRGAFLTSRAALDAMAVAGGGRIVHVTDARGQARSAVRAGLEGFTRTVALEVGPWGITVNLVVPTPPELSLLAPPAAGHSEDPDGYPERAADVVAFLTDRATTVTGQIVHVG